MSRYFEFEKPGDNYKTSAVMSGVLDNIRPTCFEVEFYILDDWYKIEVPIGLRETLKEELIQKYLEQLDRDAEDPGFDKFALINNGTRHE